MSKGGIFSMSKRALQRLRKKWRKLLLTYPYLPHASE